MKNGKHIPNHPTLPGFAPTVIIPAIMVPNGDGSFNVRAGKPQLIGEEVGTAEAARLIGMDQRTIEYWCETGKIKFRQPGGSGCKILIPRDEVQRCRQMNTGE